MQGRFPATHHCSGNTTYPNFSIFVSFQNNFTKGRTDAHTALYKWLFHVHIQFYFFPLYVLTVITAVFTFPQTALCSAAFWNPGWKLPALWLCCPQKSLRAPRSGLAIWGTPNSFYCGKSRIPLPICHSNLTGQNGLPVRRGHFCKAPFGRQIKRNIFFSPLLPLRVPSGNFRITNIKRPHNKFHKKCR